MLANPELIQHQVPNLQHSVHPPLYVGILSRWISYRRKSRRQPHFLVELSNSLLNLIAMTNALWVTTLFLLQVVPSTCSKMQIWVYTGLYVGADRWSMKFSTTQKCYTFSFCLSTSTVGADWERIHDAQAMVFYEKEQCQGTKLISHTIPKGQVMFTFDKGAKSFMVWSQGMYPTNGIEHECLERATLNRTNYSISSERDY
ncbi:unnamed protein product [Phytophthora fragariaefolia]|uniref:Unnamed protein product n=1 Tax=Phytophthora fragariaefolia TaxID=1490495 RepID=A0A9W7CXY7_9STRA|nr:unnamed protein product [Phytophthora fragariaefolia]